MWKFSVLMCIYLVSPFVTGVYVDEPLLYDTFPPEFFWGAATSSYQIEGGWNEDGKGLSIWDVYTENKTNILDGNSGKVACNSYHYYQKDVDALKSLNVSHYRFSISWPRVLPNGIGEVNRKGIDYYKRLIESLKEANIQPMVTLFHWDLPQSLEDKGGWLNPSIADWFEEYARLCFTEFGTDVKIWITLNEPWIFSFLGYEMGVFAPGKSGHGTLIYRVGHNMLLAHAKAYRTYDQLFRSLQRGRIGITLNNHWFEAKDNQTENVEAAERATVFMLGWFADPIFGSGDYPAIMKSMIEEGSLIRGLNESRLPELTKKEQLLIRGSSDFFGLNHYTTYLIEENSANKTLPVGYISDLNVIQTVDPTWYGSSSEWLKVVPFGIRKTLNWIKSRYGNPEIIITENGISDAAGNLDDVMRVYYYRHYLNNILKAVQIDHVNVTGYCAWALMDLFEWDTGYTQKFGLFSIDFDSEEKDRKAKASSRYYARIIQDHGFVQNAEPPCAHNPHA